ncbi:hypothetical protein COCCU_06915 [Corynebacterium occultum]|uniref:Alpha/beta hydrolase family protein n=1 Tax=Corynebacterium occultum TaxID=2675219 RepID=A0A6B8WLP9_9CORY|nr:hypothetical protein [Corynebacterium occultum]QGU07318.1 hypothetical protein COCCU_06915 [Corynebacterium occultum]
MALPRFRILIPTIISTLTLALLPGLATEAQANTLGAGFQASNGFGGAYHLSNDHIDPSRPVGLIVQLHGDGAGEFQNYFSGTGKLTRIQAVAEKHNMVLLAARTPSYEEGDATWWRGNGVAKSDYLAELIHAVGFGGNPIDRSRVWFSGYSGGAEQLGYYFLPRHLNMIKDGGALLTGGGGGRAAANASPYLRNNFRIQWLTGSADVSNGFCGYCAAAQGQVHYLTQGFWRSNTNVMWGLSHTDLQGQEAAVLDQMISTPEFVVSAPIPGFN